MTRRFFIFGIGLFLLASGRSSAQTTTAPAPNQKFQGFNLEGYTDDGKKSWDVKGDTADVQGTQVKIKNVDANAYGDQKMNVTAERGVMDQQSGDMRLEKDVTVTGEKGTQMVTDSLNWNRQKDLVTTDDKVTIKGDKVLVTGTGIEAHPGLKTAEIREDVRATVTTDSAEPQPSDENKVVVTSDGPMVIDQSRSLATFKQNVTAIQTDRTLRADTMEIYFNPDMKGVDRIVCIGNVVIEQGVNRSFAEKATYDGKTKKLTLSGRPKLILDTGGTDGFASFGK